MKTLLLSLLLTLPGGERERGLAHYEAGRFAEAVLEFQAAIADEPEAPDLQWNLALAAWRAGDLATAEVAAQKYAALDREAKVELHRGLLGAIRYAEAEQLEQLADAALAAAASSPPAVLPDVSPDPAEAAPQPLQLLEGALQKAEQSKLHFVRAVRAKASAEGVRNLERAARKVEQLKKRIEELAKQQQPQDQQQKQDQDKQQGDKPPEDQQQDGQPDQQKPEDQQASDQKPADQKPDEGKPDEGKPEQQPSGEEGQPPEPQAGEQEAEPAEPKPEPSKPEQAAGDQQQEGDPSPQAGETAGEGQDGAPPDGPRRDAPGEAVGDTELTPEQAQRMHDRLRELDEQLKDLRLRLRRGRRPVERDW